MAFQKLSPETQIFHSCLEQIGDLSSDRCPHYVPTTMCQATCLPEIKWLVISSKCQYFTFSRPLNYLKLRTHDWAKRYKSSSIIKITVTKVQNICTEPTFSRSKFPSQTMLTEETPGSWLWSWELWPSWCSADKEGQTFLLVSRITALGFYHNTICRRATAFCKFRYLLDGQGHKTNAQTNLLRQLTSIYPIQSDK